ncbi:MAG TPA: tRNA guanosine(34) transglycosylase Tgt [Candidatus Saccharimonadales bacterium]
MSSFSFQVSREIPGAHGRSGVLSTPHGEIKTPAFIPVGTGATLKALTPEQLDATGAQAVLANAYHLYLRPGSGVIDEAGGLGKFMNWAKPTFTDSGGFQVMSLGVGFKKVIDMTGDEQTPIQSKEKLAWISDTGVEFKSHIDGSRHVFTPELSMKIQHEIGADITFAFDELTTLHHDRPYQIESLKRRTHPWAEQSLAEHQKLNKERSHRPPQALFGVIQGAQYEDLRRESSRFMAARDFDGFGLGGAYTKKDIGVIVGWMAEELPEDKPRHMLGISEPNDIFDCIENGADTFDCVSPARVARNGAIYTPTGRVNIRNAKYKRDFSPPDPTCDCYTCAHYTNAYLNHLFRSGELLGLTLATIHNERFIVRMVDEIRDAIENGTFYEFKTQWLNRYYFSK